MSFVMLQKAGRNRAITYVRIRYNNWVILGVKVKIKVLVLSVFLLGICMAEQGLIRENVQLEMGVSADKNENCMVFIVKNIGKDDILTSPIATNENRIVVVDESGKEFEIFTMKDMEPVIIKQKDEVLWKYKVGNIIDNAKISKTGKYYVYWNFHGVKTSKMLFLKQN